MDKLNFYDSLRFLLFISFSIDIDDRNLDNKKVIRAAIRSAFNDATRHLLSVKNDNEKKSLRMQAEELVSNEIINVITPNGTEFIDKFNELCKNVISVYSVGGLPKERFNERGSGRKDNDEKELMDFKQGMAQKFINMVIKNLCIMYHIFDELKKNYAWKNDKIELPKELAENEEEFFAPVDTYTIKAAWDSNISTEIPKSDKCKEMNNRYGKYGAFSTDKIIPWSQWDVLGEKSSFKSFQSSIVSNNTETRLKWENNAWIRTANEAKK